MSSSSSEQSGMATFGQLAAVADGHRSEVHEALRRPDIAVQAGRPSSVTELGRLARVLTRYTDRISRGFGLPSDDGASARDIARQAGASLRHATAYLDRPTPDADQDTSLAQSLRAAAVALGCGLDLLDTHLPSPDSGRAPTSVAAVISAPDVAADLFHLIGDHATTAGQLAIKSGPASRPAGQFLLRAAALTGMFPHDHRHETGLQAVSLLEIPDRIPPEADEDRDQLLTGIDASVRRLDASQAEGSVTTWRYLARAATITHELDLHLVAMLRLRLEALGDPQSADRLWPVLKTMNRMSSRWRTIARTWNELTAEFHTPVIGPATDASDLVIRLGRLGYTDPTWKPGHRAQPAPTDPAQLAPTLSDVARLGLTAITTLGTCNNIAARHRHAINDVARIRTLKNPKTSPIGGPRKHGRREEIVRLRYHYPANHADGREVISRLAHLMREIAPEPDPATTLALRSAALPSPAALASADCPASSLVDGAFGISPPASSPFRQPADPQRPSPRL
ncbi:hypothetical protein AB0L06_31125 [Spirillospora sp. NPDC052269]